MLQDVSKDAIQIHTFYFKKSFAQGSLNLKSASENVLGNCLIIKVHPVNPVFV